MSKEDDDHSAFITRVNRETRQLQEDAQIAALACAIPAEAIAQALVAAVVVWRTTRKTKSEWNAERVRDFRVCKTSDGAKAATTDELADQLELHGKASYTGLESDPLPYVRDYKYKSFEQFCKSVNSKFASFSTVRVLDFSGQLLGDAKLLQLCDIVRRCPISVLNLAFNNISDKGIAHLSRSLRSLACLHDLNLSGNVFSDAGVGSLFDADTYSPTLMKIDLSCNLLGPRSAFYLGRMFRSDRQCSLESLYLGGTVGRKGWGDEFICVLLSFLCRKNVKPIKKLSIPAAALGQSGIRMLAAFVTTSSSLEVLNLTKNPMSEPTSYRFLRDALRINSSLRELYVGQGGLNRAEKKILEDARGSTWKLTWNEKTNLSYQTALELNKSSILAHTVEVEILNNWQSAKPLAWPILLGTKPTNLEMEENSLAVPFGVSTKDMALVNPIAMALTSCDEVSFYVKTLEITSSECLAWVQAFVGYMLSPAMQAEEGKYQRRRQLAESKKSVLLIALEKFSSVKIAGSANKSPSANPRRDEGEARDDFSPKSKKNKRKKRGKADDGLKEMVVGKGAVPAKSKSNINVETVFMMIEDHRAALVELGDALESQIGVTFLVKLKFDVAEAKRNKEQQVTLATKQKIKLDNVPYLDALGIAASYTHYTYVAGPVEKDRVQRMQVSVERELQKEAKAQAKFLQKSNMVRKVGPRFKILNRGGDIPTLPPLLDTPRIETGDADGIGKAEMRDVVSQKNQVGAHEFDTDTFEDITEPLVTTKSEARSDSDEGEDNESEGDDDEHEEMKRTATRFLQPKKEMQNRYESLWLEDLVENKSANHATVVALSRSVRRHHVQTLDVVLEMPSRLSTASDPRSVSVTIFTESEEERGDMLPPLSRLNVVRQQIRFEEKNREQRQRRIQGREEEIAS